MEINKWELVIHLSLDESYALKETSTMHGIRVFKETHTKRNKAGFAIGKPKTVYYIEGDARNFNTIDDLIKAVFEKTKSTTQ